MSTAQNSKIQLPESLSGQLSQFQKRVWLHKMLEATGIALFAVLFGFAAVFVLDRFGDSPKIVRAAVLLVATIGMATVPIWFRHWVLRFRSMESLARLLSRKLPTVGDSLLGAIELSKNASEQSRSPALCRAALEQVAAASATRDLTVATPNSYHRWFGMAAGTMAAIAIALGMLFPAAASNAWARLFAPFSNVPRYTFAALEPLPERLIVPHGEVFDVSLKLKNDSSWTPDKAAAIVGSMPPLESNFQDREYKFSLPPQISPTRISFSVGDAKPWVNVEPTLRPELESIHADVRLPAYLERTDVLHKDVRSGGLTVVAGSAVAFQSVVTRSLEKASVNNESVDPSGTAFTTKEQVLTESQKFELNWKDSLGLTSKAPFALNVAVRPDDAPSVFCDGLPRSKVLLDSEQVQFTVRSMDDFGVKRVGMEWKTAEGFVGGNKVHGELLLSAGSPTAESLEAAGTFQATALKIEPQPLEVRMFVEDYLPERGRVYSSPHILYVLTPNDHAIWVLDQVSRWQRESLEVRDKELQLYDTNRKIRDMSEDELNKDETRKMIEQQASAEKANARRLNNLTARGEDLLRQAARNPEIGVGHLEKWAEMQQILKDIAANRMPSVSDLLKAAAAEKKLAKSANSSKSNPMAGSNKDGQSGAANSTEQGTPKPPVPSVVDRESSQQPPEESDPSESKKKSGSGSLRLPTTTVAGKANGSKSDNNDQPEENKVDEAVRKQEELLAEFDKVADELNKLLANLEGSTLVKRLKSASREQLQIADATTNEIDTTFGTNLKRLKSDQKKRIEQLSNRENSAVNTVGLIIDDLEAFHERRPMVKFQAVLEQMKKEDVLGGLRTLSNQVLEQQGLAIAEAEYWSDTLDRWAEDLVDPACKGECKGCKSKGSLPPSVILEVMQILEAEINLRERTRVAEQAKPVTSNEKYLDLVDELATTQVELEERIVAVRKRILELPDAQSDFGKEIELMQQVDAAMTEAAEILDRPETGKLAIAAETEVIELLLKSKRINPKGGGGGGADPGGGGGGDTQDAAIALLGPGINEKEVRQDHGIQQATGVSGSSFPEEYRQGLDAYFQKLEGKALP